MTEVIDWDRLEKAYEETKSQKGFAWDCRFHQCMYETPEGYHCLVGNYYKGTPEFDKIRGKLGLINEYLDAPDALSHLQGVHDGIVKRAISNGEEPEWEILWGKIQEYKKEYEND